MKHVLLVWEEIPEATKLYLIPEEEAKPYFKYLLEAHDKYINSDDMNEGMQFLNSALASNHEDVEKGYEKFATIWAKYRYDEKRPLRDTHITAVFVSGFML